MRCPVFIWLVFVAVVFTACEPYPRKLERMEYALKQADSIYSEGENDTALFIPNLAEAVSYFAEKERYEKAALAALYNGYAEKDYDKAAAMESFKEAERYGSLAHDTLTLARAYYQMGHFLYKDYMHKEALACFRKAETGFGKHYVEKSMARNGMACCYILTKEYDSAAINLELSLTYAGLGNSSVARTKALNNFAVLYKLRGEYDKALNYLRLVHPENDEQRTLNFLNLGDVFTAMGEDDSSTYCFQKMEKYLTKPLLKTETQCIAFDRLSKWAERQGNMELALDYRKSYERLLDGIRDRKEQKSIYHIQQKFNYEVLQNEAVRNITQKQQWILIVSLISSVLLAALAISQINLAKKHKQEAKYNERMLHYMNRNKTLAQFNTDYMKALSEALEKELRSMMSLDMYLKDKKTTSLKMLESQVFEGKDHWDAFLEVINKIYPGLWNAQISMFPDLTENEQKTLLLSHFSLSRQEEALLLGTTVNMVDKLRGRVRKKTYSQFDNPE